MSRVDPVKRLVEKWVQKIHRRESELAGTRGRREHKGKASSSNKHTGGKCAR